MITKDTWNRRIYSMRTSAYALLAAACREFPTTRPCDLPPPGEVLTPGIDQALEEFIAWVDVIRAGTTLEHCPLRDRTHDSEQQIITAPSRS